jgi:GNAT superfamily N-acetyltransferase
MRWPTIEDLRRLVPLPPGYDYEQLKRADVPELIAAIERWHPDIKVGAGSAYLRESFYDEKVTLAGEAERDTFAVLFRHGGRMVGLWSWDRELDALAIYGRLLVVAPEHRGAKLAVSAMQGTERLARHCGGEFMYVMATLKIPSMAVALEHAGYVLLGFVPGYDREVAADGEVKRVFEAVYAKVLVPESALLRPDPANLTPRARALFEQMFPPGSLAGG